MSRLSTRGRYLLYSVVAVVAGYWGYRRSFDHPNDWSYFDMGARVLLHYHHLPLYGDPRLHLYVDNPGLQIGPPPLEFVAALYHVSSRTLDLGFAVLMALMGLVAFRSIELAGERLHICDSRRQADWLFVTGAVFCGFWAYECGAWKHLDDAMAMVLAAGAALVVARGRPWWLAGLLLGTAAASKPWAVVVVPLLLGLPRRNRAGTALVVIGTAAFWWGPFVLAAPDTVSSLGQFRVAVAPTSVLHLFGLHGQVQHWLRPTQFACGIVAGCLIATRLRWWAAPLAALAVRVATDPYTFGYYAIGPVLFALLFDASCRGWRRPPLLASWTALTLVAAPAAQLPAGWVAGSKAAWVCSVAVVLVREHRRRNTERAVGTGQPLAAAGTPIDGTAVAVGT